MRKGYLAGCVLLLILVGMGTSHGALLQDFQWRSFEVRQSDGVTPAPEGWVAQLIWAGLDDVINLPVDDGSLNNYLTGDDELAALVSGQNTDTVSPAGYILQATNSQYDSRYGSGDFLYIRVFDVTDFGDITAPVTLYGDSDLVQMVDIPAGPPDPTELWNFGTITVDNIIPEPSTLLLLSTGLLSLVGYVRRKMDRT